MKTEFEKELENLINRYSKENDSDTPDFILARYLNNCLNNFNAAIKEREQWYGRGKKIDDIDYIEPNDLNYKIPFEFDNDDKEGQDNIFLGHKIESVTGDDSIYLGYNASQKLNFSPEIQDAIKRLNKIGEKLLKQIDNLNKNK